MRLQKNSSTGFDREGI